MNQSLPEIEEVTVPQARYLLRKINEAKYGSRELDWSNVTVEHIIPFKPTKEWEQDTGKSVAELTHWTKRLGNVTLLDEGLNIGASNNKFTNKRQRYAESKFDLTQQLAELEEWGTDQIETREREFAELAVQVWALV